MIGTFPDNMDDCYERPLFGIYVSQSRMCLVTDASLTADQGVASSIPARSHTFVEIDHEIISTVVIYKQKYVHKVLVNCLFQLAQEKVWLGELNVPA